MKVSPIVVQGRVVSALILRDVKTRFGGSAANYLIVVGWPIVHMGVLLVIYSGMGRAAPLGTSAPLFFATGLLPFMTFQYPSRQMMMAIMSNAPLLNFPIVTVADVILARALLETVTASAVAILLGFILWSTGVNIMPRDPPQAILALMASLFLAIGVGIVNTVIQKFVKFWIWGYVLIMILIYISSGIIFVADALPPNVRDILAWNPGMQLVEWFRSAYYENYGQMTLDRGYVVRIGLITMAVGLTLERVTRRIASE